MIDYLADFGIALIIGAIFGFILLIFGVLCETFLPMDKIVKWFEEAAEDEE